MSKIISEFKIGKYLILKVSDIPFKPYNKVKIENEIFSIVPSYDTKNCVAIESNGSFVNKNIEFVMI